MATSLLEKRLNILARSQYPELVSDYNKLLTSRLAAYNFEENYPSHAEDHTKRVEEKIIALIGLNGVNNLNIYEVYILLCAIYLHDISMSLGTRIQHAKESGDLVANKLSRYIQEDAIKLLIVDVIKAHGVNSLKEYMTQYGEKYNDGKYHYALENLNIDVGYLMALLRMGDLMDWSKDRAPSDIRDMKPVFGFSLYYWMIHSYIEHITPSPDREEIYVNVSPTGPYSSQLMKETLVWFNKELQSNTVYLRRNNIIYHKFCFTKESDALLNEQLSIKKSGNIFHPFQSYDVNQYYELFGRDAEVKAIVELLFDSTGDNEVKVLTGISGVGKTSLIKSKVINVFKEFNFKVNYLDNYEQNKIDSYFEILNKSLSNGKSEERNLLIFDQFEKAESRIDILKRLNSIIENKKLAILVSTTLSDVGHLLAQLEESNLSHSELFLRPVAVCNVVKKLLNLHEIPFDEKTVNSIVDNLYNSYNVNDDISSIHIVFDRIISNKNRSLRPNPGIDNFEILCNDYMQEYFSETFNDITNNQKKLLIKACNELGDGTIRVQRTLDENDDIALLSSRKIIRTYEGDSSYEFLHDLLARYFFDNVLTDAEKEIKQLIDNINNRETIDASSLRKIKRNRAFFADHVHDDLLLFKIAHSYIKTDLLAYETEIQFWLNRIGIVTNLVDAMFQTIDSSFDYERFVCFEKCLLNYIETHNQEVILKKSLISFLKGENNTYILRIAAQNILLSLGASFYENDKLISVRIQYNQLCFNNRYDDLFEEIYFYLKEFHLFDDLIVKSQISEGHLNNLKALIENYLCGNYLLFYRYKYKNRFKKTSIRNEDPSFQYLKHILNQIDTFSPPIIYEKGHLYLSGQDQLNIKAEAGVITYNLCDLVGDIKTKWIKFSINATVKLLGINNKKDSCIEPVCLLKKDHEFSNSFSTYDVEKIIWKSKSNLFKNTECCEVKTLVSILNNTLLKYRDKESYSIAVIGDFIKQNRKNIESFYSKDRISPLDTVTANCRMKFLFGLLNFLEYLAIDSSVISDSFDIVLTCQDIPNSIFSDKFGIFDNFYIQLKETNIIDIDNISGPSGISTATIRYELLPNNICSKPNDISKVCKDEIKFCGNTSPVILIHIGNHTKDIANNYHDSVSFVIAWEERISEVSKAIDAWEYEILKLLYVLKNNNFIKNIVIVGNKDECKKSAAFIETFAIEGNSNGDKKHDFSGIEIFTKKSKYEELLNNISVAFISTNRKSETQILLEIDRYFVDRYKNILPSGNQPTGSRFSLDNAEVVKNIALEYLEKNHPSFSTNRNISHYDMNILHKCMIAELICLGKMKNDSHGKETIELEGVSLTLGKPTSDNEIISDLHFRRNEIAEYYANQWTSHSGEIPNYIDSNYHFNVNQKEAMFDILEKSILEKKNTRKLCFSFYNPNILIKNPNSVPSLFSLFILPEFIENICYLNSYFIWRTNECVFGLPLSLEACYEWVTKVMIPELEQRLNASGKSVTVGSYTYYGISMHMYNNNIMYEIVKDLLSDQ